MADTPESGARSVARKQFWMLYQESGQPLEPTRSPLNSVIQFSSHSYHSLKVAWGQGWAEPSATVSSEMTVPGQMRGLQLKALFLISVPAPHACKDFKSAMGPVPQFPHL